MGFKDYGFTEAPKDNLGSGDLALPKGWYTGKILDATESENDRGTVGYKFEIEIVEGDFARRRTWPYHLAFLPGKLTDGQKKAIQIAKETMNALFVAAGYEDSPPDEPHELIGKHVEFKIKHEKDEEWGDENGIVARVVDYRPPANVARPSSASVAGPNADDIPF